MASSTTSETNLPLGFPVIGIGASAGGLEALQGLFSALPSNSGAAFVLVTHQSPDHPNLLPDLVSKLTEMPAIEAKDGMVIEPNSVYLSSPGHKLALHQGKLIFAEIKEPRGITLFIDYFFRTLADEMKENAIGIILSGTGSDGTLGIQAIKAACGMVMVQTPHQAKFDNMPSSAIATGLVDFVLPVEKMPEQLLDYIEAQHVPGSPHYSTNIADNLGKIFIILRNHTGNDFSFYKKNTLCRRIERRMHLHLMRDPHDYIRYLEEHPQEIDLLFKELLIGVTSFFRDPAAFEVLSSTVLPDLLSSKKDGDNLRLWIAGCSTGEEVYSIAIILREYMERHNKAFHVQIYGTDLDNNAINQARRGIYPEGIALDVSPDRLKKYFTKEDNSYRIKKTIREMVVFATHNVIQDPSFTRLDFISCRNLMIYMGTKLQKQLIPIFHYSLRPKGILFLGSSETIGIFSNFFTPIDHRWKIFARSETSYASNYMPPYTVLPKRPYSAMFSPTAARTTPKIADLAEQELLKTYVPPTVIVNELGDIHFMHGQTDLYLKPELLDSPKVNNILLIARDGLKVPLSAIIREAASAHEEVIYKDITLNNTPLNLIAKRIGGPELRCLVMITFESIHNNGSCTESPKEHSPESEDELNDEHCTIKERLELKIRELEVANEELQSSNEELQSTNEELQSVTEELETSREELQSLNEELYSVNTELEIKNTQLSHAHDDMTNLLNSTGIATIFLDQDLNIKRFTMQAKKIIHLIPGDVGRPLADIATALEYYTLIEDSKQVLETLVFKEIEVKTKDACWYLMRILPYRTAENVINGIAITFVDITKIKKTEFLLATHNAALELLAKGRPLTDILDALLHIISKQSPDMLCSVMLLDPQTANLRHGSAPFLPSSFNNAMDNISVGPNATLPPAMAVYLREPVIIANIETTEYLKEFYDLADRYHLKAAWAHPIFSIDGKVYGAFTVYYKKPLAPTEAQQELINQATHLLGITISQQLMDRNFSELVLGSSPVIESDDS